VKLPEYGVNYVETCSRDVRLCLFTYKVHLVLGMNIVIQLKSKEYIMSKVQFYLVVL
jgi:hypothetical protein